MKQQFNKDDSNSTERIKERTSLFVSTYIKVNQEALAKYLQLKAERLTKSKLTILLLLFSLLFGGGSIAIIFYSFTSVSNSPSTPKISFPKYALTHAPKLEIRDSLIPHKEYARIKQFRHYLEYLRNDAEGKKIYDSLIQARPYLLDSMHQVDSIYLNQ